MLRVQYDYNVLINMITAPSGWWGCCCKIVCDPASNSVKRSTIAQRDVDVVCVINNRVLNFCTPNACVILNQPHFCGRCERYNIYYIGNCQLVPDANY